MVPDADLQLQVAIKALSEAVAPAIDPANRLAMEQLHLSIATLGLVRSGLPFQHRRARRELGDAAELAASIALAGAPRPDLIDAARALLDDPAADEVVLDTLRRDLLEQIEAAVITASGTPAERAVAKATVTGSRAALDLARAWCQPAGFEVRESVSPLDQLLSK